MLTVSAMFYVDASDNDDDDNDDDNTRDKNDNLPCPCWHHRSKPDKWIL